MARAAFASLDAASAICARASDSLPSFRYWLASRLLSWKKISAPRAPGRRDGAGPARPWGRGGRLRRPPPWAPSRAPAWTGGRTRGPGRAAEGGDRRNLRYLLQGLPAL